MFSLYTVSVYFELFKDYFQIKENIAVPVFSRQLVLETKASIRSNLLVNAFIALTALPLQLNLRSKEVKLEVKVLFKSN